MALGDIVDNLFRSALIAGLTRQGVHLYSAADPLRDHWVLLVQQVREQLGWTNPNVNIPIHADDDALFGSLNLTASMIQSKRVMTAGLAHRSQNSLVSILMAQRLTPIQANKLIQCLEHGYCPNTAVIAFDESTQPDDQGPPRALADRLGLTVDLRGLRVEHLRLMQQASLSDGLQAVLQQMPNVQIESEIYDTLAALTQALGIEGMRSNNQALAVMRANAALEGRNAVEQADLELATHLVLLPKATRLPEPITEPETNQEAPPPQPSEEQSNDAATTPSNSIAELADLVLQASIASLPTNLLAKLTTLIKRPNGAQGTSGAAQIHPQGRKGRVLRHARNQRPDLIATLQEAARWQVLRAQAQTSTRRIVIEKSDIRYRQRQSKAKSTLIFVVDASGSAAVQRLAETKGAIELLLAQCYVRRDQVAMVSFRGSGAQVMLAATRSLTRAKRQLSGLPGGGATPIAAGLDCALVEAKRATKRGETPYLILLTDGKANITREGQPGRAQAHSEALQSARAVAAQGLTSIYIDTGLALAGASPSTVLSRELAAAMQALYLPLPQANAQKVASSIEQALSWR